MTTPAPQGKHHRARPTAKAAQANRAAASAAAQQKQANRAATAAAAAQQKQRAAQQKQRAERRQRIRRAPRAAHDAAWFAAGRVTGRSGGQPGTSHLLAAELLAGAVIVAIRALGDYQLTDDGTTRGTLNTPANGGYGPFTVLAGLVASFFALSFLAAGGGKRARAATASGALIITALMIKSMDEIEIVGKFITASPADRTVSAAAFSSNAAQPWGAAWQVSSSAGATLQSSSSLAAYGAPYSASAAAPAAGGSAGTPATNPDGIPILKPGPPVS
jgi:hypothetical protein